MPAQRRITREAIVKEAVKIIARKGAGAVTFQAIATAFGVSKQAIIYWYPNKWALVADICLPFMRDRFTLADLLLLAGRWTDDLVGRVLDRAARAGGGL